MLGGHLPRGARLPIVGAGVDCVVDALIGEGGQGAVYSASVGTSTYALKWYRRAVAADQALRRRIGDMVARGSPDRRFLWPCDEVTDRRGESYGYGYLMPIAASGHRRLVDLFASSPSARLSLGLSERAHVAIEIAACFQHLHARGYCYQDINFGAFLVDPATLSTLVCDTDNIEVDRAAPASIGTLYFMAPELVRGETMPSADTDLFSLGVLIFYLLTGGHPLLGRAESEIDFPDASDWRRLLGSEPRFIFDPADKSNAAVPGQHDRQIAVWRTLPDDLRALFVRAFGAALRQPRRRVLPTEWRNALSPVRDTAVACGCATRFETVCGDALPPGGTPLCSLCGADLPECRALRLGGRRLIVTPNARLLASHVGLHRGGGADETIGLAATSPAGERGLRNIGTFDWRATDGSGHSAVIAPGRALTLQRGMRIDFGKLVAVVE